MCLTPWAVRSSLWVPISEPEKYSLIYDSPVCGSDLVEVLCLLYQRVPGTDAPDMIWAVLGTGVGGMAEQQRWHTLVGEVDDCLGVRVHPQSY